MSRADPGPGPDGSEVEHAEVPVPAWLRDTVGEPRLAVVLAVLVAIALQLLLPASYRLGPRWVIPTLEALLLVVLVVANPVRLTRETRPLRAASLILTGLITAANIASVVLLVHSLVTPGGTADEPLRLLGSGAAIYGTNVIAFGLWYWEFDRGGPIARAAAHSRYPDFLFPQMVNPELTDPEWEPLFQDYLYVSFTNALAFSPTDTMPLTRWAKMLMLVQSAVAVVTIGLVVARAVNVLK